MDWARVIRRKIRTGEPFTAKENTAAGSWNSCAIDEAHTKNPKVILVQTLTAAQKAGNCEPNPLDRVCHRLGNDFARAVDANNAKDAALIYAGIQARVTELAICKKLGVEPDSDLSRYDSHPNRPTTLRLRKGNGTVGWLG